MKRKKGLWIILIALVIVGVGFALVRSWFPAKNRPGTGETIVETVAESTGEEASGETEALTESTREEAGDETEALAESESEEAVTEVEPEEDLKDETLEEAHDEFVSGLAELRELNDEEKTFVPDLAINPEDSSVVVGDQIQEVAVEESDGVQLLDTEALEEALEDTGLVVPEGDQVSVEKLAEANDMDQVNLDDGTIILSDTYQTCRIIVKQKDEDSDLLRDEQAVSVVGPFNGTYIFQYDSPEAAKEACERWKQNEAVAYAEPEAVISVQTKKSKTASTSFTYNNFKYWGSAAVGFAHMKSVVKKTYGSVDQAPKVKVAVIDTGIDYNHPLFQDRLLSKGYDFVNGDKNASDDYMHGTACAGIIAKHTTSNVKILPLKAGDENGSLTNLDIYNALEYAIEKKVHIVNMSFGCLAKDYSQLMRDGIYDAHDAGLLLIAAYGNNGVKTVYHMPAGFRGVIGVSAVTVEKELASFSNYGKQVDLSAPGQEIYCAVPKFFDQSRYAYLDGTSMSAPYVAAAAAMFKTLHPKYSATKIRNLMYQNVLDLGAEGKDLRFGNGMIYLKKVKAQ